MSKFDNVAVTKQANVYFDGKCVSHTVQFADGTKKSVGVILPSTLTFNTGAPEIMETVSGETGGRERVEDLQCRPVVRRPGQLQLRHRSVGRPVPLRLPFRLILAEP
jgi:hypothetical protein